MCLGANQHQQQNLGTSSPSYFAYLRQSGCDTVDDVNDAEEFAITQVGAVDDVGYYDVLLMM